MDKMGKNALLIFDINDADTVGSFPANREKLRKHVRINGGINIGNRVFATAVEQYLTKPDIYLDIEPIANVSPDFVSDKYDYVIAPFANIFHVNSDEYFKKYIKWIEGLKIPFFVLGCGVQCKNLDELSIMKKNIGDSVAHFVSAIERTGGKIATRGHITKEFLDSCCTNSAIATGCPSFYRNGSHKIIKRDIEISDFSVAFTSFDYPRNWLKKQLEKYSKSQIIDQQYVFSEFFKTDSIEEMIDELSSKYGNEFIRYYLNDKIYTPADIPCWKEKLSGFSYSYGSRLHGCSMALFAGVPSKLMCVDLRCKEVADYFGIPSINKYSDSIDLFEDYNSLDMNTFNLKREEGFKIFKNFIESNGISYEIEDLSYYDNKISSIDYKDITLLSNAEIEKACLYYNSLSYRLKNNYISKNIKKVYRRVRK